MARRADFREAMQKLLSPLIARAPALYAAMDGAHHSGSTMCEFCSFDRQQALPPPDLSSLEDEAMVPAEPVMQAADNDSRPGARQR